MKPGVPLPSQNLKLLPKYLPMKYSKFTPCTVLTILPNVVILGKTLFPTVSNKIVVIIQTFFFSSLTDTHEGILKLYMYVYMYLCCVN